MTIDKWVDEIRKQYSVEIEIKDGENYFAKKIYNFRSSTNTGLAFTIYVNDKGEPSLFTTNIAQFSRFNIAEGVSQEDICRAALGCLSGDVKFTRGKVSRRTYLEFDLPTFKGRARLNDRPSQSTMSGYLSGYSRL